MGLMNKLKNILFEEEEVEIPVLEKKERKEVKVETPVYEDLPRKENVSISGESNKYYDNLDVILGEEQKLEDNNSRKMENGDSSVSEREIFKSEKTFNFPAFDEEEFESVVPRPRPTNVLAHERSKAVEKKKEVLPVKNSKLEPVQQTKFKPSPIISPVYGILDKNYTPDDITSRNSSDNSRMLDVDSVRKKAFGGLDTKEENNLKVEESLNFDKDNILEEKLEKARTIDELLKDSSDDVIDITKDYAKDLPVLDDSKLDKTDFNDIEDLDDIDPIQDEDKEDDTLESDLFDLIDSMYENREDGE